MGMRPVDEAFPVTQSFNQNLTQYNVGAAHGAVDIGTPVGTPVVAPEDGVITFADWAWNLEGGANDWAARDYQIKPAVGVTNQGGGIMTRLKNSAGSRWHFAHLSSNDIAPKGTVVRKGQIIGYTGNTGSSTGPHVHISLVPPNPNWSNGFWGGIDPAPYMLEKYAPITDPVDRKTTGEGFLNGIDVSAYQPGDIVSKVSADFVIVKTTEGVGWQSDRWKQQLSDARKRGKKVGVYHYARPGNNDSDAEADYFYNTVKSLDAPDLVWALDWEESAHYAYTAWASDFMARLDKLTGKTTVLYANNAGLLGGVWSAKDRDRPVWRAYPLLTGTGYATSFDLPPLPGGWTRLVMDQYSFFGRLPGYSGDLDLNVYYGGLTPWGAVGSASTKKDWLTMATEADLRRIVREEITRNNAAAAKAVLTTRVQNNGNHPVTGEPLTGTTTLENELKHAYLHALRRKTVFTTVQAIAEAVRPSTLLNVLKVDKSNNESEAA